MSSPTSRRPSGEYLYTFVVVADTHTNQAEDESTSPFASHRLANARCRHVLTEIDSLDHVGENAHSIVEAMAVSDPPFAPAPILDEDELL